MVTEVGEARLASLPAQVRRHWRERLSPRRRAAVVGWGSFATTWVGVRTLTHWIRRGHGPHGGGLSLGGEHLHHYNLGILGLEALGAAAVFGSAVPRHRQVAAAAYGTSTALIVDEAALLLDLRDVYWAKQGRTSVDLAVGIIALGGLAVTGRSFWSAAGREVRLGVTAAMRERQTHFGYRGRHSSAATPSAATPNHPSR